MPTAYYKLLNVRTLNNVLVVPNGDLSYIRTWLRWPLQILLFLLLMVLMMLLIHTTGVIIVIGHGSSIQLLLAVLALALVVIVVGSIIGRGLGYIHRIVMMTRRLLLFATSGATATVSIRHRSCILSDATASY